MDAFFDDTPLVVSNSPEATRIEGKTGKHGRRVITVEIRSDGKYGVDGLHQGDLIREVIAARNIIPDWTVERWSQYLHEIGRVPLWILYTDVDRFHKAIYAAEVLRAAYATRDPEEMKKVDSGLKHLPRDNFDHNTYQEQYHGKRWGSPEDTVEAQVKEMEAAKIDNKRLDVHEAPTTTRTEEPEEEKWKEAEKIARTMKREEWLGKFDPEFETRIRYCYQWLRDIGEVPGHPIDPMDVYWMAETEQVRTAGPKTQTRRMAATRKVVKYLHKLIKEERLKSRTANKDTKMNLHSTSYRTVLAAKALHANIEEHARRKDDEYLPEVKKATKAYFKAHFPIKNPPPGPLTTIDPDYHEYVVLCRKWGIEEGQLIHKVMHKIKDEPKKEKTKPVVDDDEVPF